MATGKLLHSLAGHKHIVTCLAFNGDGSQLASASNDRTVKLWDTGAGDELESFDSGDEARSVLFDQQGNLFAGVWAGAIIDLTGGEVQVRLDSGVAAMALSPDGKTMAVGGHNRGLITLLDFDTWKTIASYACHEGQIPIVAFSPDKKSIASAGASDFRIGVWDVATGESRIPPADSSPAKGGHLGRVTEALVTPDGGTLISAGRDGTIRLWDLTSSPPAVREVISADMGGIDWMQISRDGKILAARAHKQVKIWHLPSMKEHLDLKVRWHPPEATSLSPDGKQIAGKVDQKDEIEILDTTDGKSVQYIESGLVGGGRLTFSPDGKTLAASGDSRDEEVKLFDLATGKLAQTFDGHNAAVFSPDGKLIRLGQYVRELTSGKLRFQIGISAMADFSPDSQSLVAAYEPRYGIIRLWDTNSGEVRNELPSPFMLQRPRYTPDGRHVVTANANGTIYIYRLAPPSGGDDSKTD